MTESQWLTCTDPTAMLEFLRGKVSDRKLRLLAVALCWLHKQHFVEQEQTWVLAVAEAHADQKATLVELNRANDAASEVGLSSPMDGYQQRAMMAVYLATRPSIRDSISGVLGYTWGNLDSTSFAASTIREIFGNPFHAATLTPLTPTGVSIAQAIYGDRAFDRMPILADALEDASCTDASILEHCRSSGPHFRGCWVLDLVLGRT